LIIFVKSVKILTEVFIKMDKLIDDFLNDISEAAVAAPLAAPIVPQNSKVMVAPRAAVQPSQAQPAQAQQPQQPDPATQQKNGRVAIIQNQIAQASTKLAQLQVQLANELKK